MNYIHIPVKFDSPKKEQLLLFCQLMSLLRNDYVFVHCMMNFRVSAFMYHYLSKIEKKSEEESRSPMFTYWQPEPAWRELLLWTAEDIGL